MRRSPRTSCNNWWRRSRCIRSPGRPDSGAATFPDQVDAANGWLHQNKNLTGATLMQAVDNQPWDPSVKALTQFPSVLDNLAKNLSWTSALGEAYHTQAADVMSAIQALRAQAKAAGNLKSGSQITVVQQSPQVIVIQPANPQVVYVPQYNPTVVYGTPYVDAGVQLGSRGSDRSARIRSWNRDRRGDRTIVVAGGATATGTATGTAAPSTTAAPPTTETTRGTAATMDPAQLLMVRYGSTTVSSGYNPSTGLTREAEPSRPPTALEGRSGLQSVYRHLRPWCVGVRAQWKRSGWSGLQPKHGSLCRDTSNLQRLRDLRKLGCHQERQHRVHPTSNHRARLCRNGTDFGRWQRRCCDGRERQQCRRGTNSQWQQVCRRQTANGNKYAAQNGNVYKNTGSGWQQTQTPHNRPRATREPTLLLLAAMEARKRAAGHRPLAEAESGWQSRQASARGSASRRWRGGDGRR